MNSDSVPAGSLSPTLIVMERSLRWGGRGTDVDAPWNRGGSQRARDNCNPDGLRGTRARRSVRLRPRLVDRREENPHAAHAAKPPRPAAANASRLLIATRKGLWTLTSDARAQRAGSSRGPQFLGHIVHHAMLDPRDGKTLLAAARTGHLGPTMFRSTDRGKHLEGGGASRRRSTAGSGRVVDHTFWLTPGHASRAGRLVRAARRRRGCSARRTAARRGTASPASTQHPQRKAWCGGDQDGTPDGPKLHSILVDPRDPKHLYIGMSSGGVFESTDGGADWQPLNRGVRADFLPQPDPEYGHDPHCVRFAGGNPDRLYQQNHCGIYRLDRPADALAGHRRGMPKIGRLDRLSDGRCIRAIPTPLWVFPMDGTERVAAHLAGRQARGLSHARRRARPGSGRTRDCPKAQAWWTVKRQAMTADARDPVGRLLRHDVAARSGAAATKAARGAASRAHLPQIYAVEAAYA